METIAVGKTIHELERLEATYGRGRWKKCKGNAPIRLADGTVRLAELHWYEATGIGRKEPSRRRGRRFV